ncbi:hypothetical protein FRC01_009956 [Tulasnella sp. 417]|nr:hypothetical protein FRC01_009956 [Tulasnella sp. 417]
MGIAGITPFLLKYFPHVVAKLPDRFAAIPRKTLAIDATLVTQRFWFSADPHIYRHVRGWFRLISELRKSDVNVICVFDGRARNGAKSREIQKRESARKLIAARARVEATRLRRLERILSIEERYREIGECQGGAEVFKQSLRLASFLGLETGMSGNWPGTTPQPFHPSSPSIADTPLHRPKDQPTIQDLSRTKPPSQVLSPASHFKRLAVLYRDYQRTTRPDVLTTVVSTCSADNDPESAPDKRGSVSKDESRRENQRLPPYGVSSPDEEMVTNMDPKIKIDEALPEDEAARTISKLQAQLATEEGRIWSSILNSTASTISEHMDHFDKTIQDLRKLLIESQNLLESYSRRHSPPNSLTYDESRTILNAMRVPVVEAPYPYEAEAVAASLCTNGLADFVASEDTDVLIYGATMLRNVTSRDDPLVRISGEDVRNALNLTPESYVDLALLFGSDFTERLRGLGPIRATKLIQTFGSIEEILRSEKSKEGKGRRYLPEPKLSEKAYMKQIKDGRAVFSSLPPIPTEWEGLFAQTRELEVDDAEVAEILRGFDLSSEYTKALQEKVNPLEVDYYGGFESEFHSFGPGSHQTSIYL